MAKRTTTKKINSNARRVRKTKTDGCILTWDSESDRRVTFRDVIDGLKKAGLDESVCREFLPRNAFTRALRKMKEDRTIQEFRDEGAEVVFQFTRHQFGEREIKFSREAFVRLNRDTGKVKCEEHPEIQEEAQALLDAAMEERTTSDVTKYIQRLFEMKGQGFADLFPIRKQGGAYFVPESLHDFTQQIELFLSHVGGSVARFDVVFGVEMDNNGIQKAIADGMTTVMTDLKKTIDGFTLNTRTSTIESAAEKVKSARLRLDAYRHHLGDRISELEKFAQQADEALVAQVEKLTSRKEELKQEEEKTGQKQSKRQTLYDSPITSVLRWMGKNGMSVEQARHLMKAKGIDVALCTIKIQIVAGRRGTRGEPAKLSRAQTRDLKKTVKESMNDS